MKRIALVIAFLTLPVLAAAQGTIQFQSMTHDFGKMKQQTRETHEFVFYNTGSDTLRLSNPRAGCGCTAVLLSSFNIAPSDSGVIGVTFTAVPGANGPVSKHVYVNDAQNPPVQMAVLTIEANVVGEIAIDQNYVRYESEIGETEEIKLHITSTSDSPILLDNVSVALMEYADTTSGNKYHSASTRASPVTEYSLEIGRETLDPGEETDIVLGIPSREKGQINGSIRIALPNSVVTVGIAGVILRPDPQ